MDAGVGVEPTSDTHAPARAASAEIRRARDCAAIDLVTAQNVRTGHPETTS
jgi:hypothetical protein